MAKIYQINISLKGSKPKIWRRILISSDIVLSDFHKNHQDNHGLDKFSSPSVCKKPDFLPGKTTRITICGMS